MKTLFLLITLTLLRTQLVAQVFPFYPDEARLLRSGGLAAVAHKYGHYIVDDDQTRCILYPLKELSEKSDIIVEATPVFKKSLLASDGQMIDSVFGVTVIQTLKISKEEMRQAIQFNVSGGKVTFSDGTSAEIVNPAVNAMKQGGNYLIFLKRGDSGKLRLTSFGNDSIIKIDSNSNQTTSMGREIDPTYGDFNGRRKEDIISQVRQQLAGSANQR